MIWTISKLESNFGYIPSKINACQIQLSAWYMCIEYLVKAGAAALCQMQQKWECNHARQFTVELKRYEKRKAKYLFKIKSASFFSPTEECLRGNSCNCAYSFVLSVRAGRLHHCTCVFCHSSPFYPCSLPVLLSTSPKKPQGKALPTQKHPWCNHISIFPKANKQFCLSDHVLLIAKLSNLMGCLKLQSLWVRYLGFFIYRS